MNRRYLGLGLICSLISLSAFADDSDIHPSFLYSVENATVVGPEQLVVSAFGTQGGRLSYGLGQNFELRADLAWNTILSTNVTGLGTGSVYSDGLTAKYRLMNSDAFRENLFRPL